MFVDPDGILLFPVLRQHHLSSGAVLEDVIKKEFSTFGYQKFYNVFFSSRCARVADL